MTQRKLHLWCLIDARTKKMVEGLLFDEARAVVSSIDSEALEFWFAWRDDWADWRRVNEIEGLTEMIFRQSDVAPPAAPSIDAGTTNYNVGPQGLARLPDEVEAAEISINTKTKTKIMGETTNAEFTVRTKRRFKKRYQISVEIDGQSFSSFSRDISVGGINLEDPVPDWVQGFFKVRIGKPNSKKQIELRCSLIRKEGEEDRHRIKILPLQNVEDEKQLEAWIAA